MLPNAKQKFEQYIKFCLPKNLPHDKQQLQLSGCGGHCVAAAAEVLPLYLY